jgi:hypothetical protein
MGTIPANATARRSHRVDRAHIRPGADTDSRRSPVGHLALHPRLAAAVRIQLAGLAEDNEGIPSFGAAQRQKHYQELVFVGRGIGRVVSNAIALIEVNCAGPTGLGRVARRRQLSSGRRDIGKKNVVTCYPRRGRLSAANARPADEEKAQNQHQTPLAW